MAVTEVIKAYSDVLSVKVSHPKTKLIPYSNTVDFAGLIYSGVATIPVFYLRIKAKFYKERDPEENESVPQSDGSHEKLLGTVKNQKLIQVEPAPFYLHRKVKLVLQHQSFFLDNLAWIKEENYETDEIDEHDPFYFGKVFLTLKNGSFVQNPLG